MRGAKVVIICFITAGLPHLFTSADVLGYRFGLFMGGLPVVASESKYYPHRVHRGIVHSNVHVLHTIVDIGLCETAHSAHAHPHCVPQLVVVVGDNPMDEHLKDAGAMPDVGHSHNQTGIVPEFDSVLQVACPS